MGSARRATVAGLYVTRQARRLEGRKPQELMMEAAYGALTDAGLEPQDVDGAAILWPGPGGIPNEVASWARFFREPLAYTHEHWGDLAGTRALAKASAAIEAGLCDTVVIGSGSVGAFEPGGSAVGAGDGVEFADPFGSTAMAQFALVAQRYMHDFNVPPEKIAHVSAVLRNHGHVNPEAVMFGKGPYTVEDILASPMVASPLHRLECSLVSEGACAIVVTTAERARDLRQPAVEVVGAGMEFWGAAYANPPLYREVRDVGREAVQRTFGKAGVSPEDVDVFSLYDAVGFEVIRQFEMLGLCGEGEGPDFVAGDALDRTGRAPTNLDGGLHSHSWIMTGQLTLKVIECVRQLRGTCGDRQVENAHLALATNAGSGARHIEMALLARA